MAEFNSVSADGAVVSDSGLTADVRVGDEGGAAAVGAGSVADGDAVTDVEPSVEVAAEPSVEEGVLADSGDSVVAPSAEVQGGDESGSVAAGTESASVDAVDAEADAVTQDDVVADRGAEAEAEAEAEADAAQASSGDERVVDGEADGRAVESSPQS